METIKDVISFSWFESKNKVVNHPHMIVGDIALFTTGVLAVFATHSNIKESHEEQIKNQNLYRRIRFVADTNRDGTTTAEEWGAVYKSMGLHYDAHNPSRLTIEQKLSYLDKVK